MKKIIISLLVFLSFSCQPRKNPEVFEITIDPKESNKQINLLEYIDSLQYIPLKEDESTLLNIVTKLFKTKDRYIVRCHQRSALFFFDLDGNFINKITATGEGPNEFSNLMDVTFDPQKNNLFLLDFNNKKILTYSIEQEGIINTTKTLDIHSYSIHHFKSNLYTISEPSSPKRIKIIDDQTLNKISEEVTGNPTFHFVATQRSMNNYNDTLFISPSFCDTIYYAVDQNIQPYAVLGKDDNTSLGLLPNQKEFAVKYLYNQLPEQEQQLLIPRGFLSIYQNIWFMELVWENKMVIWDKKENIQSLIDFRNIKNKELLFGYQLFNFLFADEDGYIYSSILPQEQFYITATEVINSKDRYNSQIISALEKVLQTYPQSSNYENPIIVKFKLNRNFTKAL